MKSVCMTCGEVLKGDPKDPVISHGLCRTCGKAYLAEQLRRADRLIKERSLSVVAQATDRN